MGDEATARDELDNIVVLNDREFELEEPSIDVTLRILNVIGSVGLRAESTVRRVVENPDSRVVVMGLLAVLSKDDLIRLGSAVLQFENDREGRKWLKKEGLKVAPLIKALMINLSLSNDLVEALGSFFDGAEMITGTLEGLNAMMQPASKPESEAEAG